MLPSFWGPANLTHSHTRGSVWRQKWQQTAPGSKQEQIPNNHPSSNPWSNSSNSHFQNLRIHEPKGQKTDTVGVKYFMDLLEPKMACEVASKI